MWEAWCEILGTVRTSVGHERRLQTHSRWPSSPAVEASNPFQPFGHGAGAPAEANEEAPPGGFDVTMAENGRVAFALLRSQPRFDAMVLDLLMPLMSGYDLLRAMRSERQEVSNIPWW